MSPFLRTAVLALTALALPACSDDPSVEVAGPEFVLLAPANATIGVTGSPAFHWDLSIGTASYTVQVSTDPDFSTFVFNQSGIVERSISPTLTLSDGTVYFWRVIAERPDGDVAADGSPWIFTTVAPVPGPFRLSAPGNGSFIPAGQPTFSWTSSLGTASYRLQVATSPVFVAVELEQAGILTTSVTPDLTLTPGTTYFWRVLAESSSTTTADGAPWSFRTPAAGPGAFSLIAPLGPQVLTSTLPTYSWTPSSGALSYHLQVAIDVTFTTVVVDQPGITTTMVTPSQMLLPLTVYFWRVIATNGAGDTTGTPAAATFTTN